METLLIQCFNCSSFPEDYQSAVQMLDKIVFHHCSKFHQVSIDLDLMFHSLPTLQYYLCSTRQKESYLGLSEDLL